MTDLFLVRDAIAFGSYVGTVTWDDGEILLDAMKPIETHFDELWAWMKVNEKGVTLKVPLTHKDAEKFKAEGRDVTHYGIELTEIALHHFFDTYCGDSADKYGEPGYKLPEGKTHILFANWNDVPKALTEILEFGGGEPEWSDEWWIDYNYGKAYRTSEDSYHWQSSIHWKDDGSCLTPDDDVDLWVKEMLNKHRVALPGWIDSIKLIELGFEDMTEGHMYENGWHPGQTDDPEEILSRMQKEHPNHDFVFRIPEVSQFYLKFQIWGKEREDGDD